MEAKETEMVCKLFGRVLMAESRLKAVIGVLMAVAEKSGLAASSKELHELIERTAAEFYEAELLRLENESPQVAVWSDLRAGLDPAPPEAGAAGTPP